MVDVCIMAAWVGIMCLTAGGLTGHPHVFTAGMVTTVLALVVGTGISTYRGE